jgi:cystathionine beta-lyase
MIPSPDRRGTDSIKWMRHARPGRDILPFWVADMDFTSPPEVIDALRARVDHGVFGYGNATPGLVEAVRDYLRVTHRADVPEEWIVWLPGMVPALSIACRAVGQPGESALIHTPVYPPFFTAARDAGMETRKAPLRLDESADKFVIDIGAMEAALTPDTRLLLLCHPHNPVGRAFTTEELAAIRAFCVRHQLVLCSDEIHCDLILNRQKTPHETAIHWEGENGLRTITLHAPSKTYNIAGLGLSYAVIPDESLRRSFQRAMGGLVPYPNTLSLTAAEAAYRHGGPWLEEVLGILRANQTTALAAINALPGLHAFPVEATYLMWIDARGLGVEDAHAFFLEKADVYLSPGRDFGAPGFLRFNFGCPPELLAEGLRRMAAAVAALKP